MSINQKLKQYVDEKGIKQSYIRQKTGLSADAVSRVLNSTRKLQADEFLSICAALELDPNYFRESATA